MTGLLDGGLQAVFGTVFGAIYPDGTLHRGTRVEQAGGGFSTTFTDTPIKVQKDVVTEAMRREEGATSEDVRLIVLQTCEGVVIDKPSADDEITAAGQRWALSMIADDPADAAWTMRGTPA